jgi:SagB-type dehydrogenase family enzyme
MADDAALETVFRYHARSKHQLHRYARALGYLDWATQPDPFRRFVGAEQAPLDEVPLSGEPLFSSLFTTAGLPPRALDRASVSQLFHDSLALSAWKVAGTTRWSLRVSPSSGNLHPTEGYLLAPAIPGLTDAPGLFHYAPFDHALERRRTFDEATWDALAAPLPAGTVFVALSTIHWREAWKYGERAYRYCQHDVGHALAALGLAASALGWRVRLLEGITDGTLARLLGIDRQQGPEAEHPDVLLAISPASLLSAEHARSFEIPPLLLDALDAAPLAGTPNTLSEDHVDWQVIDEVARAARKESRPGPEFQHPAPAPLPPDETPGIDGRRIIRERRSAVRLDGVTRLSSAAFYSMLRRTLPAASPAIFGAFPWRPRLHLALFVHRVDDLAPGLYLLARSHEGRERLRAAAVRHSQWQQVPGAPPELDLWLLGEADATEAARTVSCHQDIAAEGAFSLGMLAEFETALREHGPWMWRRLHWEAGAIGQALYLAAEAGGVRGTGIGCFFDDVMHSVMGIEDAAVQTLYHFTVGGPVDDARLRTDPPYAHRTAPEQA